MLGTEGACVDLWARGLGLGAEVARGRRASALPVRSPASRALQMIAAARPLAALAAAWAIALHH